MSDAVMTNLDAYLYQEEEKNDSSVKKDKKTSVLKVIVLILFILVLLQGILYMVIIPSLAPAKVYYKGNTSATTSEITKALKSLNAKTWMQFNANKAKLAVKNIPGIEDVYVKKSFPDKVELFIQERVAVAKLIVQTENGSVPIQIDKNGVLFPIKNSESFTDNTVPLISGITVDRVQNDMRIPEKYRSLMDDIYNIRNLPQNYFAAISEIQVVQKEYGNYELVLYPINSRVRVLTDRSLSEESLQYMMVALDVVNSIEPDVCEVDIRYGSVTYRKRTN